MASMQSGPLHSLPSQLILLSDLLILPSAKKVRFMGCVTGYSMKKATLTLEHDYPVGNRLRVLVDIELLLNTLKSNETRIGEWVNVIGYTKVLEETNTLPKHAATLGRSVAVQALVLWPAGPLKLDGYERSLDQFKKGQAVIQSTD